MKRTKTVRPSPVAPQPDVVVHGRTLEPGTEVSIRGERGRFRFRSASLTSAGRIVCDFIGGPAGHETWRSFYPDRIRTVHRLNRTRANAAA
ncbi:hypothetical protein SEA_ROSMARINUS_75 [Mycobacterium Phage Rosmarinus]|uniref:DUF7246 domain-containing protein n=2 Tax=Anayavirus TaxID=2946797 RepID=G1BPS8_9CAUD|nr:hypothetical protein I5G89_gp26 [Mycobacterium phage Adephagia]YP_009952503.1 hypothetical protein I5G91_gp20 [Mycobacterium phage AlishaPH]AOQ29133.1 hypothetical protein SEA_HEDWIGODU_75 [Mycobacterium phage HedwigODU]APU93178.1 hypothetical protein SEA_CREW_74 [Mycobacterium phage CREW]ASR86907.1 hypothetical protein SEA_JECKYLL_75 [Mycobacterium phage Jeckyll]ASR87680.1 hypothetical protein SEA_TACHEZ_75 [Mycobacterium phage Tachez]AVR76286.1 hypothetical protein SEA_ACTINUP_76 [Mycoba